MDDLNNIKSCIRSILTANPRVSTMRSLQNDYNSLIGGQIPFRKYGYGDLESFLKSIGDTCIVQGYGINASITPIITPKIAHINDMVTKQKTSNPKSNSRYQRYHNGQQVRQYQQQRRYATAPVRQPQVLRQYAFSTPSSMASLSNSMQTLSINDRISSDLSSNRGQLAATKSPRPVAVSPANHVEVKPLDPSPVHLVLDTNHRPSQVLTVKNLAKAGQNLLKNLQQDDYSLLQKEKQLRTQQYVNSSTGHSDYYDDNSEAAASAEPVIKPDSPPSRNIQQRDTVPSRVRENLVKLIARHSDGIWCDELPLEYCNEFGRELKFHDYGYDNLIFMCLVLKDVFHCVRNRNGEYKLYDAKRPVPQQPVKPCNAYVGRDQNMKEGDATTALPILDWSDSVADMLPPDIVGLDDVIERQFVTDVKRGDVIDVVIGEIYDPSKFWFYLKSSPLDNLMDDLQVFYKNETNFNQYTMPRSLIKPGAYCVQQIFGEYHRAVVVGDLHETDDWVKLFYMDYGSVAKASSKGMCFLHKSFAYLPAQAIRCRLANIIPVYEHTMWPIETAERLRLLLCNKETKLRVAHVNEEDLTLTGFLADVTDPDNPIYINNVLVKEGRAVWFDEKQHPSGAIPNYDITVNPSCIHLYPTFNHLEMAITPTSSELKWLQMHKVPLVFCLPQYFTLKYNIDEEKFHQELEQEYQKLKKEIRRGHKIHSKFNNDTVLNHDKSIDFTVFGDMRNELEQFYKETHGIVEEEQAPESRETAEIASAPQSPEPDLNREEYSVLPHSDESPDAEVDSNSVRSKSPQSSLLSDDNSDRHMLDMLTFDNVTSDESIASPVQEFFRSFSGENEVVVPDEKPPLSLATNPFLTDEDNSRVNQDVETEVTELILSNSNPFKKDLKLEKDPVPESHQAVISASTHPGFSGPTAPYFPPQFYPTPPQFNYMNPMPYAYPQFQPFMNQFPYCYPPRNQVLPPMPRPPPGFENVSPQNFNFHQEASCTMMYSQNWRNY